MVGIKNMKQKLPVIPTEQYRRDFINKKAEHLAYSAKNNKLDFIDMRYFLNAFDALESVLRPTISKSIIPHRTRKYRYRPIQMFDNTIAYFRTTLEAGQPLTKTGIALFNQISRQDLDEYSGPNNKVPELGFMKDLVSFVEMYVEYTGQKKQNPAFQIFWLKNRGWSDKLEIEAKSTMGSLTDEERELAQKRLQNFSE